MNGLKALNEMYKLLAIHNIADDECYLTIEKELKVLQILKEKKVNIDYLNQFTINDIEFIRYRYNKHCFYNLTTEEMSQIVEWLKESE